MNDSALIRFFAVVARPQTWLGILFHLLAFPLGMFYFVFLATGLSLGVGLVVVWVGIPILLVVAGAWWLFGAFERLQARYLLGANVAPAPREWEKAEGIWAKLKAHFGSAATWKDLLYLLAKLVFGTVSFTLLVTAATMVAWFLAIPLFTLWRTPVINGTWVAPWWLAVLAVPLGILVFFVSLHVLNAWSWVCARWAEVMFSGPQTPAAVPALPPAPPRAPAAPAPAAAPTPAQAPAPGVGVAPPVPPPAASQAPAPATPPASPPAPAPVMTPAPPAPGGPSSDQETTS